MSAVRLTVVGDALLDRDVEGDVRRLAPDAPVPVVDHDHTTVRPGGAGLAAALAVVDGHDVRLVTALARDAAARELAAALAERGVELVDVGLDGATPEKVRVRAQERVLLRLDLGGDAGAVGPATAAARAAIEWADVVLVADYGRGVAAEEGLRAAVKRAAARDVPVVWDPHPRGAQPVGGAILVTPNEREAAAFAAAGTRPGPGPHATADVPAAHAAPGPGPRATFARAEALRERWHARWVCVTRGAEGAVVVGDGGARLAVAADPVPAGDACGAGDRFASRAAGLLGTGAPAPDAVRAAVAAASAFVAAGGAAAAAEWASSGGTGAGASPDARRDLAAGRAASLPAAPPLAAHPASAADVIRRVRVRGGTVVAAGGCFDLLHPGHVHTLQAARELGDCLVVCLNSDASVRRLKGPRRPLVGQADRAAVLAALGCVDAVEVFDEDTPVEVLRRLRPDVWVKGGDYVAAQLAETPVLASWGGRVIVLPFVEGRSTTRLIQEAALHVV